MNLDEFLSPLSGFSPDVGATLRELELEESRDLRSASDSNCEAARVTRMIADVEKLFASLDSHARFGSLRAEWSDLLGVVCETGMMIKCLSENHTGNPVREDFDLELHRLSAMSKAAAIVSDMHCVRFNEEELSPSTTGHTENDSLTKMITLVKEAEQAHVAREAVVDSNAKDMEAFYESQLEMSLEVFSTDRPRAINSSSVEFALTSSYEEIDAIKKSNSMRWLNDVLKWQVIDMNIQIRQKHEASHYERMIKIKKDVIREVIRNKVQQSMCIKKFEVATVGLNHTIDALYRISTASVSSTAASSPPTVDVFKQMIQSPQIKLEEAQLADKFSDMNRCLAN